MRSFWLSVANFSFSWGSSLTISIAPTRVNFSFTNFCSGNDRSSMTTAYSFLENCISKVPHFWKKSRSYRSMFVTKCLISSAVKVAELYANYSDRVSFFHCGRVCKPEHRIQEIIVYHHRFRRQKFQMKNKCHFHLTSSCWYLAYLTCHSWRNWEVSDDRGIKPVQVDPDCKLPKIWFCIHCGIYV